MKVEYKNGYAEGFTMALPECFKQSLKNEHFDFGDTIYSSQKAYEIQWSEALEHIDYAFKIEETTTSKPKQIKYHILRPDSEKKSLLRIETITESISDFLKKLQHGWKS